MRNLNVSSLALCLRVVGASEQHSTRWNVNQWRTSPTRIKQTIRLSKHTEVVRGIFCLPTCQGRETARLNGKETARQARQTDRLTDASADTHTPHTHTHTHLVWPLRPSRVMSRTRTSRSSQRISYVASDRHDVRRPSVVFGSLYRRLCGTKWPVVKAA